MRYILFFFLSLSLFSQSDEEIISSIFSKALTESKSYNWLDHLSNQIGGRLSGSLGAQKAVEWSKSELDKLGFDKVYLQPVMVPTWIRGPKEFALIETEPGITFNVNITALGGSVATPSVGLKANVIEVFGLDELEALEKMKLMVKLFFLTDLWILNTSVLLPHMVLLLIREHWALSRRPSMVP